MTQAVHARLRTETENIEDSFSELKKDLAGIAIAHTKAPTAAPRVIQKEQSRMNAMLSELWQASAELKRRAEAVGSNQHLNSQPQTSRINEAETDSAVKVEPQPSV